MGGRGGYTPAMQAKPPVSFSKPATSSPLTPEEVRRRQTQRLCSYCAQPGHMWRDCPVQKSQPERRSANTRAVPATQATGSRGKGQASKGAKGRGRGKGKGRVGVHALDASPTDEFFDDYDDYLEDETAEPSVVGADPAVLD